jgi:predicted nuclease of predicted toxin-antitoxin system
MLDVCDVETLMQDLSIFEKVALISPDSDFGELLLVLGVPASAPVTCDR